MALTLIHDFVFSTMLDEGIIRPESVESIAEIGEQNWHNINPIVFKTLLEKKLVDRLDRDKWFKKFQDIVDQASEDNLWLFDVAQLYYSLIFGDFEYFSVDMHGSPRSVVADLNYEFRSEKQYNLVTNLGTSEHIFNQAQVFKTIHEMTAKNGLIYHGLPHQGQFNHGFFNYHPTFFFDLAAANNYEIKLFFFDGIKTVGTHEDHILERIEKDAAYETLITSGKIPSQAALHIVFLKLDDTEFNFPQQGIYQSSVSDEKKLFWSKFSQS